MEYLVVPCGVNAPYGKIQTIEVTEEDHSTKNLYVYVIIPKQKEVNGKTFKEGDIVLMTCSTTTLNGLTIIQHTTEFYDYFGKIEDIPEPYNILKIKK